MGADTCMCVPATWVEHHFTDDIQTRQYRAPEAIVGRTDWGATADIWSVACVIFELLTAEYLFDPQSQGDLFGKDDDHVAQIIELLGEFGETKWGGRYSRELFDSSGAWRFLPFPPLVRRRYIRLTRTVLRQRLPDRGCCTEVASPEAIRCG